LVETLTRAAPALGRGVAVHGEVTLMTVGVEVGQNADVDALLFVLDGQRFALPLREVTEVVRAVAMHVLPNAPSIVEGIIDVRGEVVPVLDLRARFGLAKKALAPADQLVLARAAERRVAVRVDTAQAVMRLPVLRMEAALNLPRGVEHIAGVASLPDGLVLMHDLAAFLTEAESLQLERALNVAQAPASG
jgi:purine-binding chemotaxis protein CheW